MSKSKSITVKGTEIRIIEVNDTDYISLTDMLKSNDGEFFISNWLRNRNTLEYISIWERINNPLFNYVEFDTIKSKAGLNNFRISIKELIEKTNSIGLKSTTGRYGGTYAHKDIAFEFGMWISAEFKIYLIKEFQRLKDDENNRLQLEWNLSRTLAKVNYHIHTDAIKENLIPPDLSKSKQSFIYANEADLLNIALFGMTAKDWRDENSENKGNIRDYATVEQLIVLTNLESLNSVLIKQGLAPDERMKLLNKTAIEQMTVLISHKISNKLLK